MHTIENHTLKTESERQSKRVVKRTAGWGVGAWEGEQGREIAIR